MAIQPFARLPTERRLRVQSDEGLIGFLAAVADDHFIGDLDWLALQLALPVVHRAFGRNLLWTGSGGAREKTEILGQR